MTHLKRTNWYCESLHLHFRLRELRAAHSCSPSSFPPSSEAARPQNTASNTADGRGLWPGLCMRDEHAARRELLTRPVMLNPLRYVPVVFTFLIIILSSAQQIHIPYCNYNR